jgi:hypothetical protein
MRLNYKLKNGGSFYLPPSLKNQPRCAQQKQLNAPIDEVTLLVRTTLNPEDFCKKVIFLGNAFVTVFIFTPRSFKM